MVYATLRCPSCGNVAMVADVSKDDIVPCIRCGAYMDDHTVTRVGPTFYYDEDSYDADA